MTANSKHTHRKKRGEKLDEVRKDGICDRQTDKIYAITIASSSHDKHSMLCQCNDWLCVLL